MLTIDATEWHLEGVLEDGLPPAAAGTHIGMYVAWLITRNLISGMHHAESADGIAAVKARTLTGTQFLATYCDQKLWEEDLSDEGLEFTMYYYTDEEENDNGGGFYYDYETTLCPDESMSFYGVADDWAAFDSIAAVLDTRFVKWKKTAR